jgi:hypothetical protein
MEPTTGLRLPVLSPPVSRGPATGQGYQNAAGVEAAQSICDNLDGLAQQMCYATEYGVNM